MNKFLPLFLIVFITLGCSMLDDLTGKKENSNNNEEMTEKSEEIPPMPESELEKDEPDNVNLSDKKDLLSVGAGAYFVKATSEYTPGEVGRWSGFGMIDESKSVGWAAKRETVSEQSIVFRLPAETTFKTIGFDTAKVDSSGSAAKEVSVEISDNADTGFETILSTSLKDAADGQNFPVEKEVAGTFVKINAKSNFGSKEWLEIMEVRGYGEQAPQKPFEKNVSGTYDTGRWGKFHIKQEGTSIIGCYEFDGGLLEGGLDGRIMNLTWRENGGKPSDSGPAVFLFDEQGKDFTGFWTYSDKDYYSDKWDGKKVSDEVGNCEHLPNLSEDNAAGNRIENELEKDGRATVYGINFDFNSDQIKDESKSTLDQIAGILKENAGWKMTIEGHTDNIGGAAFNQTLSEKRAGSVKKYLVDKGIEESRLTAKGVGLSNPVAKNDTEAGRARNRRVELVKE